MSRILLFVSAILLCAARAEPNKIGALGHIDPAGGILELAGNGDVVAAVVVGPNQTAKRGDVLVDYASRAAAETELQLAQIAGREIEATAPRTIAAQERAVALAEREVELARDRLARYEQLAESSIVPTELAARRHAVFAAENAAKNAREALAQAKVAGDLGRERARLQLVLAEQRLARSALRAPSDGTVLEVRARPGETAGGSLVRFADLTRMVVIAEVFEVDLPKVKVGARCEIDHRVFPAKLGGRVERVGRIVNPQTKAARVWIALDAPDEAARFLGLEVTVAIAP